MLTIFNKDGKFNVLKAFNRKGSDIMTNVEMSKVLSKPWANVNDIKKIAKCGRNVAINVRSEIEQIIHRNGKKVPNTKEKIVPMSYVIDYFGLDVEKIYFMARQETLIQEIA